LKEALPLAEVPRLVAATGIASVGSLALLFWAFSRSRRGLALYGLLALAVATYTAAPLGPALTPAVTARAVEKTMLTLAALVSFLPAAFLLSRRRQRGRDTAILFAAVLLLIVGAVADIFSTRQILLARPPAVPFLVPAFAGFTLLLLTTMAEEDRLLFARATTDALTNLPNRTAFLERARREVARAERTGRTLAVVMLDIDHFKAFNDRYGHHTGDRVLGAVGQAIAQTVRGIDIAGRWGGEEFVVLLVEADAATAGPAVERIREAVGALAPPKVPEKITTSAGIAIHQALFERARIESLIRRADAALYEAKRAGRDRARMERVAARPAGSVSEVTYR
jgi:diguanylate cyclase (GGDEF)-like protein